MAQKVIECCNDLKNRKNSYRWLPTDYQIFISESFLDKTKSVVLSIESVLEAANGAEDLKERSCECLARIRAIISTFPANIDAHSVIDVITKHIS